MLIPAFDELKKEWMEHSIRFTFCPVLWENGEEVGRKLNNYKLKYIKFFNDDCTKINSEIKKLSEKKGGIYFFILKNAVLPNLSCNIMYIGRAHISKGQNLRKRCREYFSSYYKNPQKRPQIYTMLKTWSHNLYLYFIELDNNNLIDKIEEELINCIVPPFNHQIPNPTVNKVRKAVSAF